MVLDDLKDKIDIINTLLPTIYWVNIIANPNLVISVYGWLYLFIGIILTVIQMFYQRIYKHKIKFDEETQTVKSPHVINKWIIVPLTITTLAYGFLTFICMVLNPKDTVIWLSLIHI